jgi:hypothetical protein
MGLRYEDVEDVRRLLKDEYGIYKVGSAVYMNKVFRCSNNFDAYSSIGTHGDIWMIGLPTSDPHSVNALWNNSGVLTLSAG